MLLTLNPKDPCLEYYISDMFQNEKLDTLEQASTFFKRLNRWCHNNHMLI